MLQKIKESKTLDTPTYLINPKPSDKERSKAQFVSESVTGRTREQGYHLLRETVILSILLTLFSAGYSRVSARSLQVSSDEFGCDAVLVQDVEIINRNEQTALAYLDIIDSATYEEIKKSRSGGGTTFIDGVPVGGNFSYEDFSKVRAKLFAVKQFSSSRAASENILRTKLPHDAIDAWRQCKLAAIDVKNPANGSGIKCWPSDADEDKVFVTFYWLPGAGAARPGRIERYRVDGGTADDRDYRIRTKVFGINAKETLLYNRKANKKFSLTITVNGTPCSFSLDSRENSSPRDLIGTWEGTHTETDGASYKIRHVINSLPNPSTGYLTITETIWRPDEADPNNRVKTASFVVQYSNGVLKRIQMDPEQDEEFRVSKRTMTGTYWTFSRTHVKAIFYLVKR